MPDVPQFKVADIPAYRIEDKVAKEVAIKNNIPKEWAAKVLDFQWKIVHMAIVENKSIHVTRFFKMSLNRKKAFESTRSLIDKRAKLTYMQVEYGSNRGLKWCSEMDKKIAKIDKQLKAYDDIICGNRAVQ